LLAAATPEEQAVVAKAYEMWSDQFPIPAARRDFYGLNCGRGNVSERFVFLARELNFSVADALDTFGPDLWILNQEPEMISEKVAVLCELVDSEDEMRAFLRECPRTLGTTTAQEMKDRGVADMRARSALGAAWEALNFPIRFVVSVLGKITARNIREGVQNDSSAESVSKEYLRELQLKREDTLRKLSYVFFGTLFAFVGWISYMDYAYGGPVHGKGLCVASVIPSYNLADDEGNTRLPCTCAPLFRWYVVPTLSEEQRIALQEARPKVESKNCGKELGSTKKRECDPTTAGGCVWTAEDLEKDLDYWDKRLPTYWEERRTPRK